MNREGWNVMIKAGIIGATGYAGVELVRILLGHPQVKLEKLSSVSYEGQPLSQVYPMLAGLCDETLATQEEVVAACDVVFAALPHGLSEPAARQCREQGKVFVDIGADFRLEDGGVYEKWYGKTFQYPELHREAVYGIPELFREDIRGKRLIANPGCYPTSVALGLAPALKKGLVDISTIIVDSKSGATGAGRGLALNTHFTECNEAFAPYKVASHRHTPEMEQTLSKLAGEEVKITFVPHLLPLNRGIVSTMYASLKMPVTAEEAVELYREFYAGEPFVRVMDKGAVANLKNVRYSNYCDISLHVDGHTGRLIAVSTIDNMVKGAAGQAVQNMNLALGFEETEGLHLIPPAM